MYVLQMQCKVMCVADEVQDGVVFVIWWKLVKIGTIGESSCQRYINHSGGQKVDRRVQVGQLHLILHWIGKISKKNILPSSGWALGQVM